MSEGSSRFSLIDAIAIGFIGLLVAAAVIAVLPGLMARPYQHGGRRQMPSNTQLRGVHQTMVVYAQNNGNWYPGFDRAGNMVDASVEYRYKVLLDANLITGDYLLSPTETKTEWTTGPVTRDNYSFAMLDVDAPGERAKEWQETLHAEAALLSDRNTGSDTGSHISSVHTTTNKGDWRGSIAWGDNHTAFSTTHLLNTQYGSAPPLTNDNLFEDAGGYDAMMIYTGD